jgi:hypothetical protein
MSPRHYCTASVTRSVWSSGLYDPRWPVRRLRNRTAEAEATGQGRLPASSDRAGFSPAYPGRLLQSTSSSYAGHLLDHEAASRDHDHLAWTDVTAELDTTVHDS